MGNEPITILLVEDNLDHAELVMRCLAEHAITNHVVHVCDGQAALDYLFQENQFSAPEKAPRPQLVLLDLRLPKVDGIEVLKKVKEVETLRSIPIVILTTSEAEYDVARAYTHYANSYIVKPIDHQKFLRLMNDLGYYWIEWNTTPEM